MENSAGTVQGGRDKGTRRHGDKGRQDYAYCPCSAVSLSPCPLVPLSLCNPGFSSGMLSGMGAISFMGSKTSLAPGLKTSPTRTAVMSSLCSGCIFTNFPNEKVGV